MKTKTLTPRNAAPVQRGNTALKSCQNSFAMIR
ncbi:MAG: anacyclamide/piricyclamide family prenylated cyclic peptide [Microcystis aeruginosa Ma_MB_S_20031200_S102]|uniref:Anacyclamide/piricyclamide family prenylated cyclic peptide n=1 Tax=Microcystis aeruginosa Ma_MB_S_20031200_S102 TaxID=2486254 RepID=A0A552EDY1_MICAE|nr:MAG: anacyclamide/piricyclamide family prenylated cyclic peptide [Microcystis aeruginosa Ma_MB_S_20031200_S102D]TRU32700.1 MAG: anacyclamide/piricyclamide family prenylated cyclic peptide [Microcystis aeruginosa Ma_MB_S_20031200_S102]